MFKIYVRVLLAIIMVIILESTEIGLQFTSHYYVIKRLLSDMKTYAHNLSSSMI